jgi:2-polyprenyl-3-methyl-5-hydroxy-6-metoxy-1,4-benzoquinol methylase
MRNLLCAIRYLSEKLPINFPDLINNELRELHSKISKPLKVLDLGAGPGRYWKSTNLADFFISTGSELVLFDASTEFDGEKFPEGMRVSRRSGLVPKDLNSIPEDEFHVVVAIDLIEHLTKDSGYQLLYEIDLSLIHI